MLTNVKLVKLKETKLKLDVSRGGTLILTSIPSVAMSKLMQGAAQHAKSAPKGAPHKVHQGASHTKHVKKRSKAPKFLRKGRSKRRTHGF